MINARQEVVAEFVRLVGGRFTPGSEQVVACESGCLSISLMHQPLQQFEICWCARWISVSVLLCDEHTESGRLFSLLGEHPLPLQCALDRRGQLHLVSKLPAEQARAEDLYLRYEFLRQKASEVKWNG